MVTSCHVTYPMKYSIVKWRSTPVFCWIRFLEVSWPVSKKTFYGDIDYWLFFLSVESISVDELQVYWTSQNNLNVYYVLKDDPSSLMTFSLPSHGSHLLGLSPGQQPWLAAGKMALVLCHTVLNIWTCLNAVECSDWLPCVDTSLACLTPYFGDIDDNPNRPAVQLVKKSNTSISMNWTVPDLIRDCQDLVFSYPTLHYTLKVRKDEDDLQGFPLVCFA